MSRLSFRPLVESLAVAAVASGLATPVLAMPIRVDFNFTQLNDYGGVAAGTPFSGSFSFDDASYTPGGIYYDDTVGLPILSLSMNWLGESWTTDNAGLWGLTLDSSGQLDSWAIGGKYIGPSCGTQLFSCIGQISAQSDFVQTSTIGNGVQGGAPEGIARTINNGWSVSPVDVPEPGAWLLVMGGLAALYGVRRRVAVVRSP